MTLDHVTYAEDLSNLGFSAHELQTLYYSQEPMMSDIVTAAARLSEANRHLALALIQTIAVLDETSQGGQPHLPAKDIDDILK